MVRENEMAYAGLATLRQGCVFGLETMVGSPGPSVSLVSQGAECLMVAKQLFLRYANIKTLRVAGDLVMTYPCADTLHAKVKDNRRWEVYKKQMVQRVIAREATVV